jgi:GNAT superfamily N-acetyltransferase
MASPTGCIFVAERERILVGMMAGFVFEHFFGFDKIASDYVLYVSPAHRGGTLMVRLVKAFESWAIGLGADEIAVGVSTEVDPQRTVMLYERLGYRRSGFNVLKEIDHV